MVQISSSCPPSHITAISKGDNRIPAVCHSGWNTIFLIIICSFVDCYKRDSYRLYFFRSQICITTISHMPWKTLLPTESSIQLHQNKVNVIINNYPYGKGSLRDALQSYSCTMSTASNELQAIQTTRLIFKPMCNIWRWKLRTMPYYCNHVCRTLIGILLSPSGIAVICEGGQLELICTTNATFLQWTLQREQGEVMHLRFISSSDHSQLTSVFSVNSTSINISRVSLQGMLPLVSRLFINNVTVGLNGSQVNCKEVGSTMNTTDVEMALITIKSLGVDCKHNIIMLYT